MNDDPNAADEPLSVRDWLTAEELNALQRVPPLDRSQPASDWTRQGRIFGVMQDGCEHFARYQFDAAYQPPPVIRAVLEAFGEGTDSRVLAAWFHFPNGWLAEGGRAVSPRKVLNRSADVVAAARRRLSSYVA